MTFTEDDRRLYSPPTELVGGLRLGADPLRLLRVIKLHLGGTGRLNAHQDARNRYHQLIEGINVPEDELDKAEVAALLAEEAIAGAGKAAFKAGLQIDRPVTDAEAINLVDHFLEWLEGKDSPAATTPTSRPCTDCP